jgi:hypothetical protein
MRKSQGAYARGRGVTVQLATYRTCLCLGGPSVAILYSTVGRYAYLSLAVPSSCLPSTLAVHLRTPAAPVLQPEHECMYPRRQTKAGRYLSRQVAHVLTQGG